jgi:uncharacterized membrane protein
VLVHGGEPRQENKTEELAFLTHGDAYEHVLHHTLVNIYSRPFPGSVPLPKGAVWITMGEFLGVLRDMVLGCVKVQK